jgi:hypothetical protein
VEEGVGEAERADYEPRREERNEGQPTDHLATSGIGANRMEVGRKARNVERDSVARMYRRSTKTGNVLSAIESQGFRK